MNPGIALVIMLIGAVISATIASGKNRSVGGWAVLGALMPLIAAVLVSCLPAEPKAKESGGA
ncbi:MAG: hypothetical protein H0T46_28235 [Deltaproteobacteria bacterium]|nr:hypothetical protein [Deltaproteobacteria bacterium]